MVKEKRLFIPKLWCRTKVCSFLLLSDMRNGFGYDKITSSRGSKCVLPII